jgi:hypothetical protein
VPIAIDRDRDALAPDDGTQQLEIPGGILLVAEGRRRDDARGVVDGADQGQPWTAALEPVVAAAVELDEQAFLGHPLAPAAVARRPTSTGTGHAGRAQDPAHRGPAQDDALVLGQELGQMAVVAAGIAALGELGDPRRHGWLDPSRRGSAAVAVDQAGRAISLEGRSQSPDLPFGQPEQTGRLGRRQLAPSESIEDPRSALLDRAHRDRLHLRRLTKSLISKHGQSHGSTRLSGRPGCPALVHSCPKPVQSSRECPFGTALIRRASPTTRSVSPSGGATTKEHARTR